MADSSSSLLPRQPAHWAFFLAIIALGGFLRFSGLTWNLDRHSAIATQNAPTFHVDEADFANGLRDDFRLFNEKSIVMDGPLVSNLAYLGARLAGAEPGPQWDAALPLLWGRAASALADGLALLVLWLLLRTLGVAEPIALFAMAVVALSPNHVYNAHFARTHAIANFFQLSVFLSTAVMVLRPQLRVQAVALLFAGLFAILAGSARYPFLTLGLFPAWGAVALIARARREGKMTHALVAVAVASASALALGSWIGFQFRPFEILKQGFAAQGAADWQLPWSAGLELLFSAGRNLRMLYLFPGRWPHLLFLACVPAAFVFTRGATHAPHRQFTLMVASWTLGYLVLWAKYSIPWQRYSMPLVMSGIVLGAMGLHHLSQRLNWRWVPKTLAAAAILLASPAFLSGLITYRFTFDAFHPLYAVSQVLHQLPQSPMEPRRLFIHGFWNWNSPLFDLVDPKRATIQFVPDVTAMCAQAQPGDLILNLVFERLTGPCPDGWAPTELFIADNLGPRGYPYPEGYATTPWVERHYDDSQYLFQEVTLLQMPPRPVSNP